MLAALNVIARGIVFNLILNMTVVFGLIHYDFYLGYKGFTILLLLALMFVCFFCGAASAKQGSNPKLNGLFVGLGSIYVTFLFLYQFVQMDILTNTYLTFLWLLIGFFSGWTGGSVVSTRSRITTPTQ